MPFGKKKIVNVCRRRSAREQVMLAASAMSITRSRAVVISDLSLEGAQLDGRDLPAPGDDVLLVVSKIDGMAKVVWRGADKCGIKFDQALREEAVAYMKQEATWASVTGWER